MADRVASIGKGTALFETGYGPSGLPHIGTFGEVLRTTWVRRAFERLTGLPARLLAFSDDMDGLRKVPGNVPNGAMLRQHLGKPLTRIPDPFGTHESFGAHNNARLRTFLDAFGFEYEFASSTDYYASGRFDPALLRMAAVHDEVCAVILPTLGPERRATYSPFLPIHPRTGAVLQVPMEEVRPDGTLTWRDPTTGERFETPATGGHCKAQWKADWALRWFALGVDYEMSGKDLVDSVRLSSQICRVLGAEPPVGFTYELFLDSDGSKISKSRGNGLTIEDWLRYGPPEALSTFMFHAPHRAKRLHFDVIPRATDDYLALVGKLRSANDPTSPAWHIHQGSAPNSAGSPIPFSMLLNLAVVSNAENADMLWGYVRRHLPDASRENAPMLARLVEHALAYYRDFVKPNKRFRSATSGERDALRALVALLHANRDRLEMIPPVERGAAIQSLVYDAGRREPFLQSGKDGTRSGVSIAWFEALYQVLLGQEKGPRFGGFIALYGIPETIALIEDALGRVDGPPSEKLEENAPGQISPEGGMVV